MSQRLRQLLVLMLIGLQFAAPLVHAHIGVETGRQAGLHMHELEAFNDSVVAQSFMTTDHQTLSDEQGVIDLDLAIKPLQHSQDFLAVVSWQLDQYLLAVERQQHSIRFYPAQLLIPAIPQLERRSPRAPPV